jgi:hypothetical protein
MQQQSIGRIYGVLLVMVAVAHVGLRLAETSSSTDVVTARATCILQHPPFAPLEPSLLPPQVYADAPPLEPAPARPVDEAQLRRLIQQTLFTRFQGNQARVAEGLAVLDSDEIAEIVPDPRLRTALALLLGTAGEGAIAAIESGVYSLVFFDVPPGSDVGQVLTHADGRLEIIIHERLQYEDPRLLSPVLLHETLHQDAVSPFREELIATALDARVYAQFILETPRLASSGMEMARRQNVKQMALLNSRDAQGTVRLLTSQGNVYPGSHNPLPYFGFPFVSAGLGLASLGNAVLETALETTTGQSVPSADFDEATLTLLDQHTTLFSPPELVRLLDILQLDFKAAAQACGFGDLDNDGDIDRDDVNVLLADRNHAVNTSACGALCDLDGDGRITALDARKLTLLCTRPRCATE